MLSFKQIAPVRQTKLRAQLFSSHHNISIKFKTDSQLLFRKFSPRASFRFVTSLFTELPRKESLRVRETALKRSSSRTKRRFVGRTLRRNRFLRRSATKRNETLFRGASFKNTPGTLNKITIVRCYPFIHASPREHYQFIANYLTRESFHERKYRRGDVIA